MQMKKFNPSYVVGLVDGEGSFTVYVKNPFIEKKVIRRTKVEPRFYLKLIEKDSDILYELKRFFGCGNVYEQKDKRKGHQDCCRYEVAARTDLNEIIIPFFQKHRLRFRSKSKDFKIFCQIMKLVDKKEHLHDQGLKRIFLLKSKMH